MMQKCHFIGIGGIGMSGLARILLKQNVKVSGSDLSQNYITEGLIKEGAQVCLGHSSSNITPEMTVVYSSDIKKDNAEFQAAMHLKCPLLHRSDLLLQLMEGYKTLAVAGTHGKTTTTALLTTVLMEAQYDPSFAVGGIFPHLKVNAGYGRGEYFVAEADESDGTFLKYHPWGAIVTNIDTDHMDYYKTESHLHSAFQKFLAKVASPSHLFWCGDDPLLTALQPAGISYGFDKSCKLHLTHFHQEGWKVVFDLNYEGQIYHRVELPLIGKHNALNAAAVFGLALKLGIQEESIRTAFKNFHGVLRRGEIKGEFGGVTVVDDYAHHPTEIRATLKGVRQAIREKRLIAVFQPHRYSRTQACLGSYVTIFDEADELFVTDIFAAGETPIPNLTAELILSEIKAHSKIPCRYVPRRELAQAVYAFLQPHDVVLGLGAGDITKLWSEFQVCRKIKPITKLKVGVIYGGKSAEHDVSLMSANYIINGLNPDYYEPVEFGITKEGRWYIGPEIAQGSGSTCLLSPSILEQLNQCDVLFPMLHGPNGEDGSLQGLFETLGKAYVGPDYRAGAITMDKALTKKLMIVNGVPTPSFIDFSHYDWKTHPNSLVYQIQQQLPYPLYVKPVHLGSSVGVCKVEDEKQLRQAIEQAFLLDNHVIVEIGLKIREIEFAVLGNDEITVLPPGEVFANGQLYDYEGKYSPNGTPSSTKANLTPEQIKEGMEIVETAYKAAGCCGYARIDCFLDEAGKFWLNEINPIPGCTPYSLFPKMTEANGYSASALTDLLIILSLQRKRQKDRRH